VLVQVLFGLHYLLAKILLEEIPPRVWAPLRAGGAAALLLLATRALGRRLPTGRAVLGRLALYSLLGVVINQLCFMEGLSRTTATHSSIIMTSVPAGTLLCAVLLGQERAGARKIASLVAAAIGVLLVIRPAAADLSSLMLVGDLLTLVNALSYSLFLVVSKPLLERTDALGATAVLLSCGALGLLGPGLLALPGFDPAQVSGRAWACGLLIVVLTALAYLLISWALARDESSIVALFIYLQPIIAASLAVLFLGDRVGVRELLGALLVFGSVYLSVGGPVNRRPAAGTGRPA
jgi:drug/metabolite transporter (DMT)-like permease